MIKSHVVFIYCAAFGSPRRSWFLLVAHLALHSGMHSFLDFCSSPLGLVHSYIQVDKQASKAGSFFVPFKSASPLAKARGTLHVAAVTPAPTRAKKLDRLSCDSAEVLAAFCWLMPKASIVCIKAKSERRAVVNFIVFIVCSLLQDWVWTLNRSVCQADADDVKQDRHWLHNFDQTER